MSQTSLLSVLEQAGEREKVDERLRHLAADGLKLNEVMLGTLLDVATRDWMRVESLWSTFCTNFGVQPNKICYTARAKAHLLCGRPRTALRVMQEMQGSKLTGREAIMYLQAMLIVCHAELTEGSLQQLHALLPEARVAMEGADKSVRKQLEMLIKLCDSSSLDSATFPDLLVVSAAKEGVMRDWRHPAGSNYLSQEPFPPPPPCESEADEFWIHPSNNDKQ